MNYYIVTCDRQGGSFGMGRAYTAKQWGELAFQWAGSDDYEHPEEWLIENYANEEDLIADIGEWWELGFAKINEQQKEIYERLLKEIEMLSQKCFDAYDKDDKETLKVYQKKHDAKVGELYKFYEEVERGC